MNTYKVGIGNCSVAIEAHDALCVKSLVLENSVFVSIDLTSLTFKNIEHFKKVILEIVDCKNIYISVTHNFSSMHIHDKNPEYRDYLYKKFDEALRQSLLHAKKSIQDTTIEYAKTECLINVNRNIWTEQGYWLGKNKAGFSNHDLQVLLFKQKDKLVANMIFYDLQCSVLDHVDIVSGDIAGCISQMYQEKGITSFFVCGCAADQMPDYNQKTVEEVQRLSYLLYKSIPCNGDTLAKKTVFKTKQVSLFKQVMKYPTKELKPHTSFDFEKEEGLIQVPIYYIGLGQIHIVLTTPELNSAFGKQIQNEFERPVLIGTLINGGCKYLPQKEDYEKITYTAMNTQIGYGSDTVFFRGIQELRDEVER